MSRNPKPLKSIKHYTLNNIPEEEESQLYTLMCVKSIFMLKKFVEKYGDAGRRMLIDIKYKLSNCPLTYLIIRDMVQDDSNWVIDIPAEFGSRRYTFEDKRNGIRFSMYNHSQGMSRTYYSSTQVLQKFQPERIKLYYNGEHELFNDNEKTIIAKVLETHSDMLKNYKELQRQQNLIKSTDKLRGLY